MLQILLQPILNGAFSFETSVITCCVWYRFIVDMVIAY